MTNASATHASTSTTLTPTLTRRLKVLLAFQSTHGVRSMAQAAGVEARSAGVRTWAISKSWTVCVLRPRAPSFPFLRMPDLSLWYLAYGGVRGDPAGGESVSKPGL